MKEIVKYFSHCYANRGLKDTVTWNYVSTVFIFNLYNELLLELNLFDFKLLEDF